MPIGTAVHPDVKKQIIERIRNGGSTVGIAKEHGISKNTIYGWLSKSASAPPGVLQISKLKRENQALLEIIGRGGAEVLSQYVLDRRRLDNRRLGGARETTEAIRRGCV